MARLGRVPKAPLIGGVVVAAAVASVVTLKALSGDGPAPSPAARPAPTAVTTAPPAPTTAPSGFSPAPVATAFVHACDLLRPADAGRVFGERVTKASVNSESGGVSVCQYFAASAPNSISLTEYGGDPTFFDTFRSSRTEPQDVSGVGEAAFFDTAASVPTLWIKHGNVTLEVVGTGAVSRDDVLSVGGDLAGRL